MGKTGTSINRSPLHKQDNTLAFSDFEKAQELNSYFASISTIDDTSDLYKSDWTLHFSAI